MAVFIGEYTCKLDPKGRLMLPAGFKKQMPATAGEKFVVKRDIFEKCLIMYAMDEWERQNTMIRSKLNPYNKEHSLFLRNFYRGTAELELDSANRILIPKRLFDEVEISKDVVLAGQDGRIEIWDKDTYNNQPFDNLAFADLAEKLLGNTTLNQNE